MSGYGRRRGSGYWTIENGVPVWTDDYSLYLDGVDEYVNIDSIVSSLSTTTQGSQSIWYKPVLGSPASNAFFLCFGDTNANTYIALSHRTNGKLRLSIVKAGVVQYTLETNSAVFSNDTWHNVILVQDTTAAFFVIDDVKYSAAIANATGSGINSAAWFNDLPGIDNGRIGCLNFNSVGNVAFTKGNVDDPLYTNASLTTPQASDIYNSGAPKDESGIANGVSYYLMGDASGDNWDGSKWNFADQIGSNDIFTVNCEELDVELESP